MSSKTQELSSNDKRHGTRTGYNAGCRLDCCRKVTVEYVHNYRKNNPIKANDPRHGKISGYIAGCRSECCKQVAAKRYHDKKNKQLNNDKLIIEKDNKSTISTKIKWMMKKIIKGI